MERFDECSTNNLQSRKDILLQHENDSNFKASLEGDKKECQALKISSEDSPHSSTPNEFSTNTTTSVSVDNLTDDDIPLFPKNVESETPLPAKRFKGNGDDSTESVTLKNPKKSSQQCSKESRESIIVQSKAAK